jgi:hypothetical protein
MSIYCALSPPPKSRTRPLYWILDRASYVRDLRIDIFLFLWNIWIYRRHVGFSGEAILFIGNTPLITGDYCNRSIRESLLTNLLDIAHTGV